MSKNQFVQLIIVAAQTPLSLMGEFLLFSLKGGIVCLFMLLIFLFLYSYSHALYILPVVLEEMGNAPHMVISRILL